MNTRSPVFRCVQLLLTLSTSFAAVDALAECAYDWRPGQGIPGVNGNVYALTVWDDGTGPKLVVGGLFTIAGDQLANNVACWDGQHWTALGNGLNATVQALAVFNGDLVAGGDFTKAGETEANRIARWDGSKWHELGTGMDRSVHALTEYKGELYAGGSFLYSGGQNIPAIARWNGSAWSLVGPRAFHSVYTMVVYNDELIAGGSFSVGSARHLARWNGSAWQQLASGSTFRALAVHNNQLIVGGPSSFGIRAWNGASWEVLASSVGGLYVHALASLGNHLYAGGYFNSIEGAFALGIARWDGVAWQALGGRLLGGSDPQVFAMNVFNGELVVAGLIAGEQTVGCSGLARWTNDEWKPAGEGMRAPISAAVVYRGSLFAGRQDWSGLDLLPENLGRWNGSAWESIGFVGEHINYVSALRVWNDHLIVAGAFTHVDGIVMNSITRWNGSDWQPMGEGMNGQVNCLNEFRNDLIAGGNFATADGLTARSIAIWNGNHWAELGGGIDGAVCSLATYQNDLIAGGSFTRSGNVNTTGLARWNGAEWQSIGGGIAGSVFAVAEYKGDLVALGQFSSAGSTPAYNIARWDGQAWHAMGTGLNQYGRALIVYNDALIVGGSFLSVDGQPIRGIAAWNGSAWGRLGNGIYHSGWSGITTFTSFNGDLVVGGSCFIAGDHVSAHWARWGPTLQPPAITQQPAPRKLITGATASFSVAASGGQPLTYQWRKNTKPLSDDGRILGSTTDTLTIHSVTLDDAGNYDCLIANDCGQASTTPARLSVVRAIISPLSAPDVSD